MRFPPLFAAVLLLAAVAPAAPKPTRPARPNVILITLDTTRADRMGFLGSQRGLTPNLDALARQGIVFTHAYSQVPLTTASHTTILTGTYPQFNGVNDFGVPLGKDLPYLPAILHQNGYRTGAFVGSIILDPVEGAAPGFERSFDVYDAGFHRRIPGQDRYLSMERRGDEVVAHALAWLKKRPASPTFLWVHLYDAHDPYDPPEPYKSRYASAPYDGEIAYVDSAVNTLLTGLKSLGSFENSVIAVMADHGEALGGHGETAHGIFLYDETIHVPLLFKLPAEREAGKRVDARAELVDVLPTILEATGIATPKSVQGRSLIEKGDKVQPVPPDSSAYAECEYSRKAFGWSSLRALRSGKYLYIEAPRPELYDQSSDPNAEHNLAESVPAVASTLKAQLDEFRRKTASARPGPSANLDPEQQSKLGALGYVASNSSGAAEGGTQAGSDPKDKVEIANLLHDAMLLVEDLHYREAIPLLEQILAKDSNMPVAYVQLGTALSLAKDYDKALPILRRALELNPGTGMTHYELGLALFEKGDYEGAVSEMQAAIEKYPKWAALHFSLAAVYARLQRDADVQRELQQTIALKPDDFRAHLMLGRLLTLHGKAAEALSSLKKAVQLKPDAPEAHLFLAEAYDQLGQKANAQREKALAERSRRPGGS